MLKRVKIFSPRRQAITVEGIRDSDTVGSIRARVRQMLNSSGQHDALLLHGRVLKDEETAGMKLENEEEILFYTEIAPPAVPRAGSALGGGMLGAPPFPGGAGQAGRPAAPGAPHRPFTTADLASMFANRGGQAGANPAQPQVAARRPAGGAQPPAARAEDSRHAGVPPQVLREMLDMGFSELKAIAALRQSNNDLIDAVTWLSDHCDEPESFFENAAKAPPAQTAPAQPAPVAARPAPAPARVVEPSPEVKQYAQIFDSVFRAIALVAQGDTRPNRAFIENVRLPAMEKDGWSHLSQTVHRIWAGERNEAALTANLDVNTSFFVRRILELIRSPASPGDVDFYVRFALPKDPNFERTILAPLRPWVRKIAALARRQTAQALSEMSVEPSAADAREEEVVNGFVADLDAKGWQLRGPLEMLCAGVRSEEDILECITPLPNGLPDDNSVRLVRAIMEDIERPPA